MTETKVPALPAPTPDNLLQVARSLKAMLDVREGLTGNALDANVTFRDLVSSGLAVTRSAFTGFASGTPILPPWVENDGYDPTQDFSIPQKPENVTVTGLFAMVQIQWDEPIYRNHSYAEIWRSDTNVVGNAVLIGTSDSSFYTDNLGTSSSRYYWVRFVSQANVTGPYNSTNGAIGTTATDPTYLMDVLSDAYGSTSQAPFFQIDQATTINGVSIPAGTYIKEAFIADATISRAKIQLLAVDDARIASINATKITAGTIDAARIGANSITADKIDSRNLTIKDSLGNTIFSSSGTSYLNVSGLGAFATLSQITSGNISTYIASACIGSAYISDAAIITAKIADAAIGSAKIADAAITSAKIGNLAVNTLNIQGNAVTVPSTASVSSSGSLIPLGSDTSDGGGFSESEGVQIGSITVSPNGVVEQNNLIIIVGRTGITGMNNVLAASRRFAVFTSGFKLADTGWASFVGDFFSLAFYDPQVASSSKTYSLRVKARGYDTGSVQSGASGQITVFTAKR